MLTQFRSFAKTPVAKILLGVLAVSFCAWGIRDVFKNNVPGDAVIQAGSRTVSAGRYRQMFEEQLKEYGQQSGQTLTVQDAVTHNIDGQVADSIAADEALAAYIDRIGVRPSDRQILGEIEKAPRFFNAVSGRFDKDSYEEFVRGIGMTDTEFEGVLRSELAQTQYVSGLAAALRAPLLYSALSAAYDGEGRTFDYFVLPATSVPMPAQPTDAQMQAFIKENAARLMRPEARAFTVVGFSTARLTPTMTADPGAVQKRFDFEKDALSTAEKRSLVEIPVRDAAEGAKVAALLKAGGDPQAVAAGLHIQPVVYADSAQTAIGDKKIADLAFAAAPGAVVGPVQGDLGLAVFKVGKVTPGHQETLDEARPKIEAEVKADAARAQVNKSVQTFEAARAGGSSLADAAKAAGAQPVTLPPITAKGQTLVGQQVAIPPKVLQAGFALQPGQDSDIVDLGAGEYAAMHLDKVVAPSPPALDEIKPLLTRYMMQQSLLKALQAKADAIADQVKTGQTMEAAAAAAHVTLGHGVGVLRSAAGQSFSRQLLAQVFNAKPGDVMTGPDVKFGLVVAKLQAIAPATAASAAQATADQRKGASQAMVQEFATAVRNAAKAAIKPKVDYKRARAALGVDQGAPS